MADLSGSSIVIGHKGLISYLEYIPIGGKPKKRRQCILENVLYYGADLDN
jgi:hypothetical protein